MVLELLEGERLCGDCKHYYPHYVIGVDKRLSQISYGHCGTPRLKGRKAYHEGCAYWEAKEETK